MKEYLRKCTTLILTHHLHKRVLVYVVGLFVLSFGIVIAVNSGLGISPMTSFPVILSEILGTRTGTTLTVVFLCFVLVQKILYGKEFRWYNISQILFSFLFGFFVNFAEWVLRDLTFSSYFGQLFLLFFSIAVIALGLSIYMDAKLVNLPAEGFVAAVSDKIGIPFSKGKVIIDCIFVAIGICLSLLFIGGIWNIREGTILAAIFVGKSIPLASKITRPLLIKLKLLSPTEDTQSV